LYENKDKQIPQIVEDLISEKIEYYFRTRAQFEIDNPMQGTTTTKLCLNEVFAAEKDVSCTSMYKLQVDDKDMGKFKSSGIIISTGTGSSGWLYSARQITAHDVGIIKELLNSNANTPTNIVSFPFRITPL
jgi:NAD+ kinase